MFQMRDERLVTSLIWQIVYFPYALFLIVLLCKAKVE